MSEDIQSYFEKAEIPDSIASDKADDVLLLIFKKRIAYTTEIARECDLHIEVINRILYELKSKGFIRKYTVPEQPDKLISSRIEELWDMGVRGLGGFRNFSWWTITEAGADYAIARGLLDYMLMPKVMKEVNEMMIRYEGDTKQS